MPGKATCNDCYFRRAGLCALPGETPCPTFRAVAAGGSSAAPTAPPRAPAGCTARRCPRAANALESGHVDPARRSESTPRKNPWTARRIVLAAIAALPGRRRARESQQVAVNFVFFKTEASLFVVLLLAIALGFVAGWLFDDLRDRRRRRRDNA